MKPGDVATVSVIIERVYDDRVLVRTEHAITIHTKAGTREVPALVIVPAQDVRVEVPREA